MKHRGSVELLPSAGLREGVTENVRPSNSHRLLWRSGHRGWRNDTSITTSKGKRPIDAPRPRPGQQRTTRAQAPPTGTSPCARHPWDELLPECFRARPLTVPAGHGCSSDEAGTRRAPPVSVTNRTKVDTPPPPKRPLPPAPQLDIRDTLNRRLLSRRCRPP